MDAYQRAKEAKRLREAATGKRAAEPQAALAIRPDDKTAAVLEAEEAARAAEERLPEPYDKRSYRAGYKAGYMAGRRHG